MRHKRPAYSATPSPSSSTPPLGVVFLCVPALKTTHSLSYARAQAHALAYWLGATVVEGASLGDLHKALGTPTEADTLPQWLHVCGDGARTMKCLLPHRSGSGNTQEVQAVGESAC